MKKLLVCLLCVTHALLLMACKQTPTEKAVITAGSFLDTITESPFTRYSAPNHYENNKEQNNLNIMFDADVLVPEAKAYSVAELKQIKYTEEEYSLLMDYFCPNAEWIYELERTKADILQQYYDIQASDRFTEQEKYEYEFLLKDVENAPDAAEIKPFVLKNAINNGAGAAWSYQEDEDTYASFYLQTTTWAWQYLRNTKTSIIQEAFLQPEYTESDTFLIPDFEQSPSISIENASEIANQFIEELGLANDFRIYTGEQAIAYVGREPLVYGWQFIFTRTLNGLQAPYSFDGWTTWKNSPPPTYAAPWGREMITVFVDEKGIYKCDVRGLSEQTSILYENVELLPFEQLISRIEQQMINQHAFQESGISNQSVTINSIELGLSVIDTKNKAGYGMLIPSWTVNYCFSYDADGMNYAFDTATVFNAIDGSYIEPRTTENMLGY